jgi:diaminohydroxyphosphoribosylaminopyrimidine deaminase/5-amino-6-(5-phosphoribosylamino)uracil reductase
VENRGHLEECFRLAAQARGATSPNPLVGAVVVRGGDVVGRGYHRCAGADHAERVALAEAAERAVGATLYVNMEPCTHHGRTPPCVEAVLAAGIRRVVISTLDPDHRVNGNGVEALRAAGVTVDIGELAGEAARLNDAYLSYKIHGAPLVTAKAAISLDGRLATRTRASQWISGEIARRRAHGLRAESDAVVVGVGTLLHDDPRLTARNGCRTGPRYRVVLDTRLRTPVDAKLLAEDDGQALIFCGEAASSAAEERLVAAGAVVVRVESDGTGVSWDGVLAELADREVMSVLLEGGGGVLTSAFEADIIAKLFLVYAPLLIGGSAAVSLWGGEGVGELENAPRLHQVSRIELGDDWAVEGYLHPPEPPLQRH